MGLGSKLRKKNKEMTNDRNHALDTNLAHGGYNTTNIENATVDRINNEQYEEINDTIREASNSIGNVTTSGSLSKPNVPYNVDSDRNAINALIVEKCWRIIVHNKLEAFYTQTKLQNTIDRLCLHDYRLIMKKWNIDTFEQAADLAVLGLFDIVMLVDDSGSTAAKDKDEDGMTRFEVIEEITKSYSFFASLMDEDGICFKFLNNVIPDDVANGGYGISKSEEVDEIFDYIPNVRTTRYSTPIAASLASIADEMVLPFIRDRTIERPVLILVSTDGAANDENAVIDTIIRIHDECKNTVYGSKAISIGFMQVGDDEGASSFLDHLDEHPEVGHIIDCNSNYTKESAQCLRNYGIEITVGEYLVKCLIGAIDDDYDKLDESSAPPPYSSGASSSSSSRASSSRSSNSRASSSRHRSRSRR